MSVVGVEPPQAMLSVLEFAESRGYAIDKLYIDRFWSNISEDQWIYIGTDTLLWLGYLSTDERKMKKRYVLLLSTHFVENEDYKQLNASEIDSFFVPLEGLKELNRKVNICPSCRRWHHRGCCASYIRTHRTSSMYAMKTQE
jgi:hypothetical protein